MKIKVLVLRTAGINCDAEMVTAWQTAGAEADLVHINELAGSQATRLYNYAILAIPGGFAYGDDLGAGKLLANELVYRLKEPFGRFVEAGRPVLGVCNGFQVLAKTGLFGPVTLRPNGHARFECRWTHLQAGGGNSLFLRGVERLYLPVAHGEGRVEADSPATLKELDEQQLIALRYCDEAGRPDAPYPYNPNGSVWNIAGLSNRRGNVLGLMPHPERFVSLWQHPHWTRLDPRAVRGQEGDGLQIFRNAVEYARQEL